MLNKAKEYYRLLGIQGVLMAALAKALNRPLGLSVRPRGFYHPFTIRLRTADWAVFQQIFGQGQYSLPLPAAPARIIDAGANIGLASLFYTRQYPAARILALEPEPENYGRLCRNVAQYPNITPLNAALWSEVTTLNIFDPGIGAWGFRVAADEAGARREPGKGRTQGLTIGRLMEQYGWESVDLLKLDIEGAEKVVLDASDEWIDKVNLITAELHDWLTPGCTESFAKATRGFPFTYHQGEKVIASRVQIDS